MRNPRNFQKEYTAFCQIRPDLLLPITGEGIDGDTLVRLYESKLVYLENLREKAFMDINSRLAERYFQNGDYLGILEAIEITKLQLKEVMIGEIRHSLGRRKAG